MKQLNVILAISPEGGIGYMNGLPWKLKGDLARFKQLTTGNIVIMGRNTYESLPNGLLDRMVIVVSEQLSAAVPMKRNLCYVDSLESALKMAENLSGKEVYVAGGVRLYQEAMKLPCRVMLTTVFKKAIEGYDTYIPNFSVKNFVLVNGPEPVYETDEVTGLEIISHVYSEYRTQA